MNTKTDELVRELEALDGDSVDQPSAPPIFTQAWPLGLLLFLAACQPQPQFIRPDPIPLTCDAACLESCLPKVWPKWQGDPEQPATWDRIGDDVIQPLREIVETCNARRNACVACIKRIEGAGLICGVTNKCNLE